jgi:ring-1,2-phenylacetyl-CoA epoxidase subunit PaaE
MSTHFHTLKIAEVRRETPSAVSILFDVPEAERDAFAFRAGQHITLRADINGEDLRRNYSLCVAPHEGQLRVAIKAISDGRFSRWANTALAAGDTIEVMPPHGSFSWDFDANAQKHYVGFAGGSGITPVLSLLKTTLLEEPRSRFTLFYGNRASNEIMFLEEIAALKDRFLDRLEAYHFLEDEDDEDIALFNGRLDSAKLTELLGGLIDADDVDAAFICGPGPMMDAVETALTAAGVPADRIKVERFTIDRPSAEQAAVERELEREAEGRKVEVTLEGRRRRITFDSAQGSNLENARAAGLQTPFACKAGVCATCRAKLIDGKVHMKTNYGLSPEEVAQGYILTCQAVPLTDNVAVDYDA